MTNCWHKCICHIPDKPHTRHLREACVLRAESQKQYWQVKSKYRDTIIFFKVGKFYELYEVGS